MVQPTGHRGVNEHIGRRQQPSKGFSSGLGLKIKHHRLLVRVEVQVCKSQFLICLNLAFMIVGFSGV